MIDQEQVHNRRIVICDNCNQHMKPSGSWPRNQKEENGKLVLATDEVWTLYHCMTESCRTDSHLDRIDGKGKVKVLRTTRVIEPDLFVRSCANPEYTWEIFPRNELRP